MELAGYLEVRDRTDESPMGVPWIDGRACRPKHSYGPDDLKGEEGRALMARLLAEAGDGEAIAS
ncbi:hypothetical protein [Streptomyces brasiliensis]|uniref:Uncharacterized protein n=1 Tax=Streptomyces brasiliensis TaxID=1954 RepID=A0A917LCE2_9ACTN|nr:hypothetical protein [Streptomyces brasiliensis]GGJ58421.1 hypothetical protein GCM10010121_081330 [Streptomyces brasiliensis]